MATNTNQHQRKRVPKSTRTNTATNTAKSKSQTKAPARKKARTPMRREVKIFIMGFVSLVIMLSYYTPVFGIFGGIIKNIGLALLGASAYALPVIITAILLHKAIRNTLKPYTSIYIALCSVLVCLSLLFTISASGGDREYLVTTGFFNSLEQCWRNGIDCVDGGLIGALGIPLMSFFGTLGSQILIIFAIIILLAWATKFLPVIWLVKGAQSLFAMMTERFARTDDEYEDEVEDIPQIEEKPKSEEKLPVQTKLNLDVPEEPAPRHRVKKAPASEQPKVEVQEEQKPIIPDIIVTDTDRKDEKKDDFRINIVIPPQQTEEPPTDTPAADSEKSVDTTAVPATAAKKEPNVAIELSDEDFIETTKPYEFPPIDLLARNTNRGDGGKEVDLREQAKRLVETLKSFGVEAKVLEVSKGPTVTRFELQPAVGVKVSKIVNLADDIALNLAALSVRIEAPIPGKAAVGIEIPNTGNSMVRLREVIDSEEFRTFKAKTAFALGKDISGKPIVTDISKMPHVLIAGTTGSGKSVCINSLITSIIYKADPNEVKFIMIDPKVVELKVYNGIPHLLIPVVTDARKAAGALNWAVQEMTKRYKMFADNNVRDLKGYNELAELQGEKKLEQIIIIVDELADLMMVAPRDVEDAICRLAQMARAAGMHLVIATQSPRADIITGLIKTNIPSRIAFAVQSQLDSRIIMDIGGAEKLLGKGDMLFLPMGASKPTRIQGAFISDGEVEKIIDFVKQEDVKYDEDVMEKIENGVSADKEDSPGDADELLPKAIEIVVEAGQASASLLQRRLSVGYSRAGRLIDQLEARGIIGPHEGAKPRAVLMSRAEYAEMMMQNPDAN